MEQVSVMQVVARRVQELRQRRGWSAQKLADRCADAGFPGIKRQVITNLENGRRESISLDEVLGLAYVLDAPALLLFLPLDGRSELRLSPTVAMSDLLAFTWVTGEREPYERERRQRWREVAGPLNLHRDFWRFFEMIARDEWLEDEASQTAALRTMAQIVDTMIDTGITPPGLPGKWLDTMQAKGWLKRPDEVQRLDED